MNNLRNQLFYKFALVVFIIILVFEVGMLISLKKSFDSHLKDKLALIATEINPKKFSESALLNIQHKYKVFPLFVNIKRTPKNLIIKDNFKVKYLLTDYKREKILVYTTKKDNYIIQVATFYSTNEDKFQIITTISLLISF